MNKKLFLAAALGALGLAAGHGSLAGVQPPLPPTGAKPVFSHSGALLALSGTLDGRVEARLFRSQADPGTALAAPWGPETGFHRLRADRAGIVWAVWQEQSVAGSSVAWSPVDPGQGDRVARISTRGASAGPPDLAFDAAGRPWLIWVEYGRSGQDLCIAEGATGRTWTVFRAVRGEITPPRILADSFGGLWVFWTAPDAVTGHESLMGRRMAAGLWQPVKVIAVSMDAPCTAFDAEAAADGRIWCAWAEYRRGGYRVRARAWDGSRWSRPFTLGAEPGRNDSFPCLAPLPDGRMLLSWQSLSADGVAVTAAVGGVSGWSAGVRIASGCDASPAPQAAASAGRLAFLWSASGGMGQLWSELASWSGGGLPVEDAPGDQEALLSTAEVPPLLFNPSLHEEDYTAFGDSITKGQIAQQEAPDKGYPPRLELLLKQVFGTALVHNEGWPGEYTDQGLVRIDSVIAAWKSRYFLLLEGTNDTKELRISMATAAYNLKEMARKCQAAGVFPAISTLLPRFDPLYYFPQYIDRFNELNTGIRQLAADLHIPLVDLNTAFLQYPAAQGGVDALLSSDRKHPSELGYQCMAETWRDAIRQYPFPPTAASAAREEDKILFTRVPGVLLTWTASPKPAPPSIIAGYRVYRREAGQGLSGFRSISETTSATRYFDTNADAGKGYEYTIEAFRLDGARGPCSPLAAIR